MSQPQNTIINGPSAEVSQPAQDTTKTLTGSENTQQFARPPLLRLDSRTGLPPRLGYPNQQGAQYRPPQPRPPFTGATPPFGPRPPLQRNPSSGQFNVPPTQPPRQGSPNPSAGLRPATPFPRSPAPPSSRPPPVFQQRPYPPPPKSPLPEQVTRSQTLDTPDLSSVKNAEKAPLPASINEEEISTAKDKNHPEVDNRRVSVSSTGSVEENRDDIPSRPESRAHMGRIIEDEARTTAKEKPAEKLPDLYDNNKSLSEKQNIPKAKSPVTDIKLPKELDSSKTDELRKIPTPEPTKTSADKPKSPISSDKPKSPISGDKPKSPISTDKPKSPIINEKPRSIGDKPKSPVSDQKLNLKLDENRPKSPRTAKTTESPRSPRNTMPDKPRTLKPERSVDHKNGLLKSPTKSEGDNDSGVDESTQGNDQSSNGDHSSPRKPSGKIPTRSTASPTKNRSVSRGSKSPNPLTPDSPTPSTPGTIDKKKVPMNKVQVGSAPSPNLKVIKSKIGSLQNSTYKPGGGNVKIENKKIDLASIAPKIAAKNQNYVPGGGDRKIEQRKLQWNASSKIGSLDNAHHKPKGGDKKIETMKLDFKDKAKPKVGSKDNIKYVPGGGDVKIETKKLEVKAKSKVGSLDNVKYKPGGGDKKIFDDKEYLRQKSGLSGENNSLNGSQRDTESVVHEYYSPEVNVISPTKERVRIIETVTEIPPPESRPSSRLSRNNSLRKSKLATPREAWKF